MKLTETLDEDILELELVTGAVIKSGSMPLIRRLAIAGDFFESLGVEDATGGHVQRTWKDFIQWGEKELPYPHGEDVPIVALMYKCYLDGYQGGGYKTKTLEEMQGLNVNKGGQSMVQCELRKKPDGEDIEGRFAKCRPPFFHAHFQEVLP